MRSAISVNLTSAALPEQTPISCRLGRKQQIKKLQKSQNHLIIKLLQVVKGVIHSDDDDDDDDGLTD